MEVTQGALRVFPIPPLTSGCRDINEGSVLVLDGALRELW